MKIYFIYLKSKGKKGPAPLETIAHSEQEKNDIVQFLMDNNKEYDVKERDTESFDDYKNRVEKSIEREKLIESAKNKISPEELQALIESTKK